MEYGKLRVRLSTPKAVNGETPLEPELSVGSLTSGGAPTLKLRSTSKLTALQIVLAAVGL